jgi:hypothetical protein
LNIVIIATMKPPIPAMASIPIASVCPAEAFQAHAAVAVKMASSTNVLPTVPWIVIVVLAGTPKTCSYPANMSLENAGLLVATVKPPDIKIGPTA